MRHFTLYFLVSLWLTSCTIRFDRFPKDTVGEFPKEMTGKFLFANRTEKDSTYVVITPKTIAFSDNKILRGGGLSDSIKLAKGEKFYYICWGDSSKNKVVWDVYPVKVSGSKLYFYALNADYYKKSIHKHFKPISGFDDLYEMDEKALSHFCKRKLKTKNALKLKRVE